MSKVRVGVLFGGRSGEHEVSLASARSVMAAIDRSKYHVIPIWISAEGRWIASGDVAPGSQDGPGLQACLERKALAALDGDPVSLLPDPVAKGLYRVGQGAIAGAGQAEGLDVVFPILHGTYGEDGTVQGLLELAGIPYVGAGVLASAVGLDKILFKDVMRAHRLPVVADVAVRRRDWECRRETVLGQVEEALGYPVFTKPANLGSSVGVSKCADRAALTAGLDEAARYDRKLVAEKAVPNAREIEVSVLGNDDPAVSVPGEVVPSREFYSYEAKYVDVGENASELLIPAPIPRETADRVRELAIEAYLAIDCAGMARADFLLAADTGELYVNELNTIPGFTEISMYPKLWEASGLSYRELVDRLISLAIERHQDRARNVTRYGVPE